MEYGLIVVTGYPGSGKSTLLRGISNPSVCPDLHSSDYPFMEWPQVGIGDQFRDEYQQETGRARNDPYFEQEWWPNLSKERQIQINLDFKERVKEGSFIIDSRHAGFYDGFKTLDGKDVMKIGIKCDLETRAKRYSENMGKKDVYLTQKESEEHLLKRMQKEVSIIGSLFGDNYDYRNDVFDVVLDTSTMSLEEEIEAIANRFKNPIPSPRRVGLE